jgi:hypothetical protein
MADPVTIGIMATAASKAMSTASGLVGGMGQASQYDAQAKVAKANAASASAQADAAEENVRRQGRQKLGEQVAGIAQSGVGFTQTAKDLTDQAGADISLDALNKRFNGAVNRTQFLNDAAMDQAKAKTTRITTMLGAGSQLLQDRND